MKKNNTPLGLCNIIIWIPIVVCVILSSTTVFADANSKIDVKLVKQVEITGEKILLGDLVIIEGSGTDVIEKLQRIFISKAPLPGKMHRIDRQYIGLRLKQNNIDLDQIQFTGTVETEVVRGYNQVTKEEIEKLVATDLPDLIGIDDSQMSIKDIQAAGSLILPKGKYTYSIVLPKNTNFLGKLLVSVYFKVEDGFEKRVYVSANIEQYKKVVMVRWPLKRNHLIQEADVKLQKMNLGELPSNCVTDIQKVLGNKLKRNVNRHTVLRTDMIDIPPLIKRRDVVLMVAESDSFKIVTLGESKEIGHKGDLIKVINLESNNEVYARVIDSNSVKVEF